MSYQINLDEVDVDGAISEAAEEVSGDTRLGFLKKTGVGAVGVMSGGAVLSALRPDALSRRPAMGVPRPASARAMSASSTTR